MITIAVAGSTLHTVQCAQTLFAHTDFKINWLLTPSAKPMGRDQVITKNPVQLFAEDNQIPCILLHEKIDSTIQEQIQAAVINHPVDFLLVVDFGYLIPSWLLHIPKIAPLNVHPSALPRWRGSSPGQFCLLYGDTESAVTLMEMNEGLDTGPILLQLPFIVQSSWTQTEYYQESFSLICTELANAIKQRKDGELVAKPQPILSPTPQAKQLSRADGFIDWPLLRQMLVVDKAKIDALTDGQTSDLLQAALQLHHNWPVLIEHAVRALSPWPLVWTIIPTSKGNKRMQILSVRVFNQHQLELENVKIEGQQMASWSQVKNILSE